MALYDSERHKVIRKAPQLTADHVHPNLGKKMRVSIAAQVLSRRTAAAMKTSLDELPPSAPRTADMLEFFNQLFDFFNSNSLLDCGTRRPALRQLWDQQEQVSHIGLLM